MMNQAIPYLMFAGKAKEALEFYREVFQWEVSELQTYGEANYPTPPEADNFIMHAKLKKDRLLIMVSDSFPGQDVTAGNHISLVLEFGSEKEIQSIYNAIANKGTVLMELQDTFWGAKYAKVKDPFGVIWDLNYTKK